MIEDDENIDEEWPDPEQERPTVVPPDAGKRETPPVLRLDSASEMSSSPRSRQATISNEAELEDARIRSLTLPSDPPPPPSLSDAAMRRASLLSLADGAGGLGLDADALDLVAQEADRSAPAEAVPLATGSSPTPYDPVREMHDRFSLGDYSGALVVAESLLDEDPDHDEAQKMAESCRVVLEQMYTARIGPLDRVAFVAVPREQLRWLSLDHRAGFVLSHVDGISSLEQILDVSGMPPLDALRILYELLQQRVIGFR